jgi:hypothetical protein
MDMLTIEKRRLVTKKQLSVSFDKGVLQIQRPKETVEGPGLHLFQKFCRIFTQEQHAKLTTVLEKVLRHETCPTLQEHITT